MTKAKIILTSVVLVIAVSAILMGKAMAEAGAFEAATTTSTTSDGVNQYGIWCIPEDPDPTC